MIVTTEEMVRWLRGLPPDQGFCTSDHCPIMEYLWREHMTMITAREAMKANEFIAGAADRLHSSARGGWRSITPKALLHGMGTMSVICTHLMVQMQKEASILSLPAPRGEETCITQS